MTHHHLFANLCRDGPRPPSIEEKTFHSMGYLYPISLTFLQVLWVSKACHGSHTTRNMSSYFTLQRSCSIMMLLRVMSIFLILFVSAGSRLSACGSRWLEDTDSLRIVQHMKQISSFSSPRWDIDVTLQTWRVVAGIVCGAMAAALSSAGGVGGGGLYVPIFNLLLGFDSKTSAALSSCMILGGTLVNLVWYSFRSRPDGLGPLVDYHVALICLPNVLLGISAGVMLNVASPSWLVTVLLIIVLFFMTFRSCRNALQRWDVESSCSGQLCSTSNNDNTDNCPGDKNLDNAEEVPLTLFDFRLPYVDTLLQGNDPRRPLLEPCVSCREPQFPRLEIGMLAFIWIAFLAVQLVRGSSDGQNIFNIKTCGATYWIVTFLQLPFAIIVTACTMLYFMNKSHGADTMDGDDDDGVNGASQGSRSMGRLPVYVLVAGLLGGMLGLGGGTIISPLFLELGMDPQVTAATCSYMVFFSSSLSVIQFWLLGRIPEEYALFSAALSLLFSIIGLKVVQAMIRQYGRVSFIVFSVSTVMGISAALMAFFGSWDVITQIEQGAYMGFRSPC